MAAEPPSAGKDVEADEAIEQLAEEDALTSMQGGSRIIGRLLPPAVRLWLRSQVDQAGSLEIELTGRDRQILMGYLPGVSVSASRVVYKGLFLSQVQLSAADIRINVGQVIRGKPLRLLKPFPVSGSVVLNDEDLDASLSGQLLTAGLLSFWRSLTQIPEVAQAVKTRYGPLPIASDVVLAHPQIRLGPQCLGLSFYPSRSGEVAHEPVVLGTKLSVIDEHFLQLNSPTWLPSLVGFSAGTLALSDVSSNGSSNGGALIESLDGFRWDLGADTRLSELTIEPSQLLCCGQLSVRP